ncbi:MAG: ATP-binding protein, partial [Eubacterium sp.]|nr:ATP-binding protein [Eubacterium sp.]
ARLVELILNRDGDFSHKLAELEKNNLLLQERLAATLVKGGYPADYLDPPHDCPLCRDTGVADGRRCSCIAAIVKRLAAEELNRSSPLDLCDFADFRLDYYDATRETSLGCTAREAMTANLSFCRAYAADFHLPYPSVLMCGGTGLGKTHLSLSIARKVLEKGYSVVYGSAPELFRRMEREHFGRSEGDTAAALQEAQLLILDDLGAEFESKFYAAALYGVVNNRLNAALPTIVNTNCSGEELNERYGERVFSRLASMEQLLFVGGDIRMIKANRPNA